jgi:uncharacterized protein YcaQ
MGQLLDARRPKGILDVVNRLGFLQMDPTAPVARTEHLVLWSRLGAAFKPAQLARKTYVEHQLFEYRAFLYPTRDFPLYQGAISSWIEGKSRGKAREWLAANAAFHRYVVTELRRRGPLRSRDLEDRAVVPWPASEWSGGRNTGQMLEILAGCGEVAVAGRDGNERLWDLGSRVLPKAERPRNQDAVRRELAARRLRNHGVLPAAEGGGLGVPVDIEGLGGSWVADEKLLATSFAGRAAILSPFDRLVYDRPRTQRLFGFEYRLEMYVPADKRRWGYYSLPVLNGERLVARVDAKADRDADRLRVLAMHRETHATRRDVEAAEGELQALASWLGLAGFAVDRVTEPR